MPPCGLRLIDWARGRNQLNISMRWSRLDPLDLSAALLNFVEVNSDEEPTLASRFGIRVSRRLSSSGVARQLLYPPTLCQYRLDRWICLQCRPNSLDRLLTIGARDQFGPANISGFATPLECRGARAEMFGSCIVKEGDWQAQSLGRSSRQVSALP